MYRRESCEFYYTNPAHAFTIIAASFHHSRIITINKMHLEEAIASSWRQRWVDCLFSFSSLFNDIYHLLNIQYHHHLVSRIMKATKKVAMAEQRKAPSLVEFIIFVTMMAWWRLLVLQTHAPCMPRVKGSPINWSTSLGAKRRYSNEQRTTGSFSILYGDGRSKHTNLVLKKYGRVGAKNEFAA
jgi:hypothetical protein